MTSALHRLKDVAGFALVGCWEPHAEFVIHFPASIPPWPGVYAFVEDEEVRYVGSAQRGLYDRFLKYKNFRKPGPVATRVRAYIGAALNSGHKIDVYVSPQIVIPDWRGLPIDGIAGLEEGLIREFQPKWNRRGIKRWEELKEADE